MDQPELSGTSECTERVVHLNTIRPICPEDVSWLVDVVMRRYPHPVCPYATMQYILQAISSPDECLVLRGARTVGMISVDEFPFNPDLKHGFVYFLISDEGHDLEPLFLLKRMVDWAKKQGAELVRFNSETTADIGILMKRLGAKQSNPMWTLTFGESKYGA